MIIEDEIIKASAKIIFEEQKNLIYDEMPNDIRNILLMIVWANLLLESRENNKRAYETYVLMPNSEEAKNAKIEAKNELLKTKLIYNDRKERILDTFKEILKNEYC